MYSPKSCIENRTHKILWDFEIQTAQPILARQPDIVIVNKKKSNIKEKSTCQIVDFAVSADHREKIKEREKRNKYWTLPEN